MDVNGRMAHANGANGIRRELRRRRRSGSDAPKSVVPRVSTPRKGTGSDRAAEPARRSSPRGALLAAFAGLFAMAALAVPAAAQDVDTVWSATLKVRIVYSGPTLGCGNASTGNRKCSNSSTLSDDDFTDDSTNYAIKTIFLRTDGRLEFELDTRATAATQGLTLVLDSVSYFIGDATSETINNNKSRWRWSNPNLNWSEGDTVEVSLVVTDAPATGQPTISGGGQVGKTLTAATDYIEDPDGLPTTPTFTYQWVRVDGSTDTDIPGAASETYTLTASDLGKQIKVTVSFTDFRGHAEGPLTSDAYPRNGTVTVVVVPGPCPAVNDWCATMTVADDGTGFGYEFDKSGSLDDNMIEYGGKEIEVFKLYVVIQSTRERFFFESFPRVPLGTVITVGDLTLTTDAESNDGSLANKWDYNPGELPPDLLWLEGQEVRISLVLGNFPAEGTVTISGTAQAGETLTAEVSGVSDLDGLTDSVYTYQWVRVDSATSTDIPGATGNTYSLVGADAGKKVQARVGFTDDLGAAETLSSDAYPASGFIEQFPNTDATGSPTISGVVQVGLVLTAGKGTIADANGTTKADNGDSGYAYTYQWIRVDGGTETNISGATSSTYTPVDDDEGKKIKVRVSFQDDAGYSESRTSAATATVSDNDNATAQVTGVTVEWGNARLVVNWTQVGNATGYKVQWKTGDQGYNISGRQATVTSGSTTSHTIRRLTNGTEYTVRVKATRAGADDGPWSAEAKGTPVAAGVTVSRTALAVVEGDPAGDTYTVVLDGEPTANVTVTIAGHSGTGVTPSPTTLTFTPGNWFTDRTVTVTAANGADGTVSLTHGAGSTDSNYSGISIAGVTVTVTGTSSVPDAPTGLSATANGSTRIHLSWTAPANDGGSSITGYKIEFSSNGGTNWVAANTSNANTTYSHTGLAANTTYHYRVSAINFAGAGPASNVANASTNSPSGICNRTAAIRDRILVLLRHRHGYSGDCSGVTDTHLAELTSLDVHDSGITSLKTGDFAGLSKLKYLSLSDNSLTTLPNGIFSGLNALEELRILNNQLSTSLTGVFVNLPKLRKLSLAGNNLQTFPFDDIETLDRLTTFMNTGNPGFHYGVQARPLTLAIAPGDTAQYKVRLTRSPGSSNRVTISALGEGVDVSPGSRTYTSTNWFRSRTFAASNLEAGQTGTITHSVTAGFYLRPRSDTVTVNAASGDGPFEGESEALAVVAGLSVDVVAGVLFGEAELSPAQRAALDYLGNRNGSYDLGDVLSWTERCRRGGADCGGGDPSPDSALPANRQEAKTGRRRGRGTRPGSHRDDDGRRRGVRRPRTSRRGRRVSGVRVAVGAVLFTLACGIDNDATQPFGEAPARAEADQGILHVTLQMPTASLDIGIFLAVEGPAIDSLRAPGFELLQSEELTLTRRLVIIGGRLSAGPILEVFVPPGSHPADYRVEVLQIAGSEYELRDPRDYSAVVSRYSDDATAVGRR